jgi:hypothetical protein
VPGGAAPVENPPGPRPLRRILTGVLRLDPAAPLLWRSPTCAQLGDPALAVLDPVPPAVETVLRALAAGAELAWLRGLAAAAGLEEGDLSALLERIRPALLPPAAPAPVPLLLDGPPDLAAELASALLRLGHASALAGGHPDEVRRSGGVVLVAAHHVLPPARYVRWLAADVPHLAVVVGDRGATIGPFVVPGATPCLRCRDEHRLAADPAWPALAAQLLARPPGAGFGDPQLMAEVAVVLGRALAALAARRPTRCEGASLWIDRTTGEVSRRAEPWHERCSCCWPDRGRDRAGTATGSAPSPAPAIPSPPTRGAAVPAPA